jgi:hypothetical protein
MYFEDSLKELALYLYSEGYPNFATSLEDCGYDEEFITSSLYVKSELLRLNSPHTMEAVAKQTLYLVFSSPFIDLPKLLSNARYVSKAILTWRLSKGI